MNFENLLLDELIANQEGRTTGFVPVILKTEVKTGILHILHGMKEKPWISLTLKLWKGNYVILIFKKTIFHCLKSWQMYESSIYFVSEKGKN